MQKRVLFLVPHLGGGGAERVTAHLAAGLPADRYRVHLCVAAQGAHPFDALPERVTLHDLGARRVRGAALPLLRLVWRLRPELIFSCMYHMNFLTLLLRPFFPPGTRCIVRQNNLVEQAGGRSRVTRGLYRALYPRAERIVCQTEEMAGEMRALLGAAEKLCVLPNPVAFGGEGEALVGALWDEGGPRLVAVGRLAPQKGFDLLLPAFAEILGEFPQALLAILGQGPEEAALRELSAQLGIAERVRFAGHVTRPQEWFREAALFVLSSRYEGMSNAMLEAAAAGLPIAAAPGMGGVGTLLAAQPGCWVAEEVSSTALARTLRAALHALTPGARFAHEWLNEFRMENALRRYEALFEEVLAEVRA